MEKPMSNQYNVKLTHGEIDDLVLLLDNSNDPLSHINLRNKLHYALTHNIMIVDNSRFICNMYRQFIHRYVNSICKLKILHTDDLPKIYISIPKKESYATHFGLYCDPDSKRYLSEFWEIVQSMPFNDGYFD